MYISSPPNWLSNTISDPRPIDIIICISVLYLLGSKAHRFFWPGPTLLSGPPAESWMFGVSRQLFEADDPALLFEEWAEKYGPAFRLPQALGSSRIVLCDPKAVAYFYGNEITDFRMRRVSKIFIERLFGRGLIWAEGDSHKRQRKALTPGFSNQAIRALTTVFFDSAFKLKTAWDATLDASSSGVALIDVQDWMNKVSLDTIGIAGFSHDFGTLVGQQSKVARIFDSFTKLSPKKPSFASALVPLLTPVLPLLARLPSSRLRVVIELNDAMEKISYDLLARTRVEKRANNAGEGKGPKSLIETLILAEDSQRELTLTESEVLAQMKTLILAGYETTSISLTWALINLCLHQDVQDALRAELSEINGDPTFDQLSASLPFLDAVTKETLRLHPPVPETIRMAAHDLVIPLSTPLTTPQGKVVDSIHVAKGTSVGAPIRLMNRSKALWGENAQEFIPSRWLSSEKDIPNKAKEIHGWAHILTFIDGPRTCLGRQFAVMEFKTVLATLIRHYEFKLPDGADTKFEQVVGILPRPKVKGEAGSRVPVLVKRVE
ncbi:cytochrome P450 [Ramaria rubella]|nr:cytochrome P450 [Ramaria rubella]